MQQRDLTTHTLFTKVLNNTLVNNESVHLEGWVRTNRDNGSLGFIEFNDGSFFKNVQLVYNNDFTKNFEAARHIQTGSAISVEGKVVLTPESKQPFEIQLNSFEVLGTVDEDYPLQKKRHSFEFLREIPTIRQRSNTFNAVYRIRDALSFAFHKFFHDNDFLYIHTPIITANDAEGAGETFKVVTDLKKTDAFFSKDVSLTVSGQLHVEPFALTYRNVYTFGPTFRAEKSNTSRHAAEFWMIEPEIAFADLEDDMVLIENCVKYVIDYVLKNCKDEMNFFDSFIEKGLLDRLNKVLTSPFRKMSYTEGIEELKKALKDGVKFENKKIEWGMDLQSEHERYLTEIVAKSPLFLTDYPQELKSFYMRLNDDGKTVAAVDLLVPGIGELVGGSQREERKELLEAKMKSLGNLEGLEWYLDTRRYGGCKHAGFGIGFDRFIMFVTGLTNIRDVQPYPRAFGMCKY